VVTPLELVTLTRVRTSIRSRGDRRRSTIGVCNGSADWLKPDIALPHLTDRQPVSRTAETGETEVIEERQSQKKKVTPRGYAAPVRRDDFAWRPMQIGGGGAYRCSTLLGEAITAGKQTSPTRHAYENDKHRGYGNTDNDETPTS
jgi:hypothetical protein